jgi:hypothetical protein
MNVKTSDPDREPFDDEDLVSAMESLVSFVDATPEDLREVCRRATERARTRGAVSARALPAAPAGLGALVLLVIALAVNNLARGHRYPEYWW